MTSRISTDSPAPLVTAASIAAVEGVLVVLLAILELFALSGSRLVMGLTTALFFGLYGVALGWAAWFVTRGRAGARGFLLLAQLLQLGIAWSLRGGETTWLAIGLAIPALIVIAGLLHPDSIAALDRSAGTVDDP